ncbi:MAG: cis-L-3-hydroxyproline dehydratase [Mycobacterium sp.]|jgi:L-alanine-DL-glutamate epimerase-like enolase superfamily enzyme|nr:cis-L-3-hydroxyproline dehydratase [Mycobacterium sp.]
MKLHSISCFSVDIPAAGGSYVMSHGRDLSAFPATVVKVTADDGTTGWGEAGTLGGNYLNGFPGSARETVKELAPFVLTCDPMDAGVLADGMDALLIGHLPGKAAIDTAMWDLRGKLLGLPVATLLGGIKQRELGAFQAVSLTSPQGMADEALSFVDLGFRRFQLKLGDDPIDDAKRTHAVASAVAGVSEFMTSDANRGWTVAQAKRYLQAIRDVDTYVEQPCASMTELALVARHSPLPLMMDESGQTYDDVLTGHHLGITDALNLKITRVGGLTKAARIRDLAEATGIMIMVDEPQGADLATGAMAQLAASIDPQRFLGVSYFMGHHMTMSYQKDPGATGPVLTAGKVVLDDAPGLGVSVDEELFGDPSFVLTSTEL